MNAPAKQNGQVADAWKIIHYALGKFDSGSEVFSEWLGDLPKIDLPALRETCEAINERKRANSFVTVTLATVRAEYLARVHGQSTEALPACAACDNMGVVGVVVAGEGMGDARIVRRSEVAPWGYVAGSTLPCQCHRGQAIADKLKIKPAGESRMRYLQAQCVMSLAARDAMVRECRLEREKQQNRKEVAV